MRNPWFSKLGISFGLRPPRNWVLLCLVCVLVVIALLGSSSSNAFDSVVSRTRPDIYTNYRRLKEQTASDYLDLRSLSLESTSQGQFSLCGREIENYVPCYNVSRNIISGLKDGEEFDRHCDVWREQLRCLLRPPKDYKIPLRWPSGEDVIWSGNLKISRDQFLSSGGMTKRLMLLEENQITFRSDDGMIYDGIKDYSRQIADMIGLGSETDFLQAGVHTVLDIGCGFGSFGAHLLSLKLMAVCMAAYEPTGSQVQLALERGLPAIIGDFITKQLPYPSLSFDMVHCTQCGILWDKREGMLLIEVDRILKPGGYFVLTSPAVQPHGTSLSTTKRSLSKPIEGFIAKLCWTLLAQQDDTFVWQKTMDANCYISGKKNVVPLCKDNGDTQSYYQPLVPCVTGATSKRWIPIQNRSASAALSRDELEVYELHLDDVYNDFQNWKSMVTYTYWSLLTPLIFSDHPKRPGDEDPSPPYNMLRNVMDMNAHYGGLNAAFMEARKSVWVMNVVPVGKLNTLPFILDQGFAGVLHDWCEPFPTYPRTYDMLHANELLSHVLSERCSIVNLFMEMDRILRPEGWVIISDKVRLIERARAIATQVRWESRVVDLENGSDQRLLVCQKLFLKK